MLSLSSLMFLSTLSEWKVFHLQYNLNQSINTLCHSSSNHWICFGLWTHAIVCMTVFSLTGNFSVSHGAYDIHSQCILFNTSSFNIWWCNEFTVRFGMYQIPFNDFKNHNSSGWSSGFHHHIASSIQYHSVFTLLCSSHDNINIMHHNSL